MLPSRGAIRSLSSARSTLQSQNIPRTSRVADGHGRRFGTSTRITGAARTGLCAARPNAGTLGTVMISGSIPSSRAFSLWTTGNSKPVEPTPSAAETPVAEASASAAPTSSSPAATPTPEAAVSTPSALPEATAPADASSAISELLTPQNVSDIPEQIGYLKSLGLDFGWGPTSVMQWCLEHVYIYTGLPWWASIALVGIGIRVALFHPTLKSQQSSLKMQRLQADPAYATLRQQMQEALAKKDQPAMMEARQALSFLHKREGINPFGALWGLAQIPFGYGMFRLLTGMGKIPVPSLENGGMLWFTDLSIPDPFFVLPVAGPVLMIYTIMSGAKYSPPQTRAQMKLMGYVMAPLGCLVTLWLPAGVQLYFIVASVLGVAQNALFRYPLFRRWADLGPLTVPGQEPPNAPNAPGGATYQAPTQRSNTIPVSAVETTSSEPSSQAAPAPGPKQGAMESIKQTIHQAKGGMGTYVENAKREEEEKNTKAWNERRAAEDRRKFRAELKKNGRR